MRSYEDYNPVSRSYDQARQPVSLSIMLDGLSRYGTPLESLKLIDAGCAVRVPIRSAQRLLGKRHCKAMPISTRPGRWIRHGATAIRFGLCRRPKNWPQPAFSSEKQKTRDRSLLTSRTMTRRVSLSDKSPIFAP
jgi:hypothetical protein